MRFFEWCWYDWSGYLRDKGGGSMNMGWFQICFYFHPETWGRFPIWRAHFSDGVVQPPTRWGFSSDAVIIGVVAWDTQGVNPERSDHLLDQKVMVRCCSDENFQHVQNCSYKFGNFYQSCGALQNLCYGKLGHVFVLFFSMFLGLQSLEIPKQFGCYWVVFMVYNDDISSQYFNIWHVKVGSCQL